MSLFVGDGSVDDILSENFPVEEDQLPCDGDDNDQIFGNSDQQDSGNQPDEAVAPIKVQPKKRSVLNPRPRLNVEVLRGPRGLHTIEDYFKDVRFKGKGKEKEDLDEVIRRLQHWGHRMYPNYIFDDVLTNIERLGKKKPMQVHMSRYRLGMLDSMKNHDEINDEDDDEHPTPSVDEPYDEFDALLDEQIAISKIDPRTPGPSNSKHSSGGMDSTVNTPLSSSRVPILSFTKGNAIASTPYAQPQNYDEDIDLPTFLPSSQPLAPVPIQQLNADQMARIAENKRLAQERLAARRRAQQELQEKQDFVQM